MRLCPKMTLPPSHCRCTCVGESRSCVPTPTISTVFLIIKHRERCTQVAMDLSYKFPSEDNMAKRRLITYVPLQADLLSRLDLVSPCQILLLTWRWNRFKQNQTDSPLLRLPAELRTKIWQSTLGGNRILPPEIIRCHDFYPCPSNVYLFAESYENMRYFLSLLRVCHQTYHEARLFPFSCNIWEFWVTTRHTVDPWLDWMWRMNLEQLRAIEWILVGGKRWEVRRREEMPRRDVSWARITSLEGVKVIIRRLPMQEVELEKLDEFATKRGCRVIDEETVEFTGMYATIPWPAR